VCSPETAIKLPERTQGGDVDLASVFLIDFIDSLGLDFVSAKHIKIARAAKTVKIAFAYVVDVKRKNGNVTTIVIVPRWPSARRGLVAAETTSAKAIVRLLKTVLTPNITVQILLASNASASPTCAIMSLCHPNAKPSETASKKENVHHQSHVTVKTFSA